jgi:4-hydroxy-tetrahydrodipicolinate synthase
LRLSAYLNKFECIQKMINSFSYKLRKFMFLKLNHSTTQQLNNLTIPLMFSPSGSIVALVTPMRPSDGAIDEPRLRESVNWQIESGTNGIVPVGTTGESATLTHEEHRRVVSIVIEEARGRVPVIAGAGSNSTAEAVALAEHAKQSGADAILSIGPYYNKPTQEGFFQHFKAVASVGIPVILYNVPGRTGKNITAETTLRLAEIPNIVAIKEASCDLNQAMEILRLKPDNFAVLSGEDSLALPILGLGGTGAISVVANEIPKEFSEMVQAALTGNCVRAREIHFRFLPLMAANFLETNPICVKTALGLMGKIDFRVRLPLTPMEEVQKKELAKILKELGLIN